ncbi:MAG: type II secretion system protein [Patescibacteria group bacterium]
MSALSERSESKGFTLVELLVVISIIAILTTIGLVLFSSAQKSARDAKRIADLNAVRNALELFYNQTGKYPMSAGHATWSGHWANFSQCLETGTGCGFTISNYSPVIAKVPQDPLRKASDPFADDKTYYPGYPTGCDGQSYRLAAYLETNSQVLQTDLDGSFYHNNGGCDETSSDYRYCIGEGTCSGW